MPYLSLPYVPKERIARDLRDYIYRSQEKARAFNNALASALAPEHGGQAEMKAENIKDVNDYIRFVDELLRWAPKVSSTGDELLRKLLVFYWVFDQPSIRGLQTAIHPESISTDLKWLSYWMVSFARELGHYMDTLESAKDVASFYENPIYNKEAHLWEKPDLGWQSFNHWFARHWEDISVARPIANPDNDSVIVHSADSKFDGSWEIKDGTVTIEAINAKGIDWPVNKLLQFIGPDFQNGSLMHAFLSPHDYHRQHAPVSGEVIEVKNIQDQVYLQVTKKRGNQGLIPDRGLNRDPAEVGRRLEERKRNGVNELDAPDDAGYQWCQTRGLIIIQTDTHGKVAVLPIGMAQVSSVVMTVKKGDRVNKGDNVSYFKFGGSDVVLVFQKKVNYREDLKAGVTKLNVREKLATFR